jgi:WD40 repeat protein
LKGIKFAWVVFCVCVCGLFKSLKKMAMMMATNSSQVQSLLLHKARCFDVKTIRKCGSEGSHNVAERAVTGRHGESDINTTTGSSSGRSVPETEDTLILTSSEDGTAVLWSANTRKHLFVFRHSTECEVLRSNFVDRHSANRILTCGADGTVLVWTRSNAGSNDKCNYTVTQRLSHKDCQIYSCECVPIVDGGRPVTAVLTAADNCVYIWKLFDDVDSQQDPVIDLAPTLLEFEPIDNAAVFGGVSRNEDGKAFIFDLKIAPINIYGCTEADSNCVVVAVAMSDCSVRIERIIISSSRGTADSSRCDRIHLVPLQPYLIGPDGDGVEPSEAPIITSVSWRKDASLVLAALGNGEVAVIDALSGVVRKVIRAHASASFGALFAASPSPHIACMEDTRRRMYSGRDSVVTWARDGTIK